MKKIGDQIVPAIISGNEKELHEKVEMIKNEVSKIHIDVMDGNFVPRESTWFPFSLPKFGGMYEAHLMIRDVSGWLKKYSSSFDSIVFHAEIGNHNLLLQTIGKIHEMKKLAILAFNPETPWENYLDLIHKVDGVQVMCVHPGSYGADFIPRTLDKVKSLKAHYPRLSVQVDGGMREHTLILEKKAGADLFVVGGRIFRAEDPLKSLWVLEKAMRNI